MKLDKIKFAKVIAFIVEANRSGFDDDAIETLDSLIDIEVPAPAYKPTEADVNELLRQIANPDGFINAIKAYRVLTGVGLKESKEAVEKYRVIPKFKQDSEPDKHVNQEPATLGDILHASGRTKAGNNIA